MLNDTYGLQWALRLFMRNLRIAEPALALPGMLRGAMRKRACATYQTLIHNAAIRNRLTPDQMRRRIWPHVEAVLDTIDHPADPWPDAIKIYNPEHSKWTKNEP
jgi:hypothetical protein